MADTAPYTLEPVEGNPLGDAGSPGAVNQASDAKGYTLEPVDGNPLQEPSTAQDVASGVVTGGVAQTLGLPADFAAGVVNAATGSARQLAGDVAHPLDTLESLIPGIGEDAAKRVQARLKSVSDTPLINQPTLGTNWWNEKLGEAGLPTTENTKPTSTGGRLLQQAIRSAAAFASPGIVGKAIAAHGLPSLGEAVGSIAPGSPAVNAAIGAASGASGEAASELYPHSSIARPIAEAVTGGLGAAAPAAAAMATHAIPPLTAAGRAAAAEQRGVGAFDAAATQDVSPVIAQQLARDNAELVAGSTPTTAEVTNDPGLAALQRTRERMPGIDPTNPLPTQSSLGEAVTAQRASNNDARVRSMEELAPAAASPERAQNYLRQHLNDIDLMHAQSIDAERRGATAAREPVTPTMTPEEQGQVARGAVEAERAPAGNTLAASEQSARQDVAGAVDKLGGDAATGSTEDRATAPAQYGEQMRDPVQAAYLAERARLNTLRQSIDPEGTMGIKPDAIKAASAEVANDFLPDTFGGMENKFYDRVAGWGDLIPINDAFRLRADINARLRNVGDHSPQEAARLMIVKRGVDESINQAVTDTHATEQAGSLAEGAPGIDERMSGLENERQLGPNFTQDVARAYASNPTTLRAAGRDETGRGILEAANQPNDVLRARAVSPRDGVGSQGEGRLGNSESGEGVPQNPPLTPLTPEARDTFAQWNRGYAEMARQYRGETGGTLHAVGKMLQKGGAYDSYRLTDGEVPWLFVNGGKTGREAVERFLQVAPPEAQAALDDAFAFSLRRAAQREDGTLDLKNYSKWLDNHEGAMSARPELLDRFNTAAKAQRRLDEIRQNLADHDASHPLKPGWGDAGILRQFWKPGPQGGETMQHYIEMTGGRPEAIRAAEDYAALDFASRPGVIVNGEVNPRAAQAWISQHDRALAAVPGLKDKFANAVEAQKAVEQAIQNHLAARKEFTESVAGSFIADDPDRAINRVFTGSDRAQKASTLMSLVSGNKAATEGVQRAAIDYILQKHSGAPIAGSETGALTPQKLQNFIAENRNVLDVLFPGGAAKNFDAIAADLQRSQLTVNAKKPGGSDTAELTGRMGGHSEGSPSQIVLALLGEHLGSHLVGHLGGLAGAILAPLGMNLIKSKRAALQVASNEVLDRMLLDPQYALDMKQAAAMRGDGGKHAAAERMTARLVQDVVRAAQSSDLQSNSPRQHYARGGAVISSAVDLHRESAKADPEPTEAQKSAGNYRHGHVVVQGLPITIENAPGSVRRGVGPDGRPWHVRMPVAYGYLKGSLGADSEHVDAYIGHAIDSDRVYVIDQKDARTGKFDEHKAMIAFPNRGVALANYRRAFSDGKADKRIGGVTEMTVDQFKDWIKHEDTTRPAAAA